jgi:hypothetical protein
MKKYEWGVLPHPFINFQSATDFHPLLKESNKRFVEMNERFGSVRLI